MKGVIMLALMSLLFASCTADEANNASAASSIQCMWAGQCQ